MNAKSTSGLTLLELIVVLSVLILLAIVIQPPPRATLVANMTAVSARGRDVFTSIERANAERKALGLSTLWPTQAGSTNGASDVSAVPTFASSTEFFRWLYDEANAGKPCWKPRAPDFDYSRLAGAGVRACSDEHLKDENTIWTVASNVRDDMSDLVPILITRNIDARSLASRVTVRDLHTKSIRFDARWPTPFGDKVCVMIRKSGAVFCAKPKYLSYQVVYQQQTFDTSDTLNGRQAPPLKYLTPTGVVTPSDQAYTEGVAEQYRLTGGWRGQVKRSLAFFAVQMGSIAIPLACFYLPCFAYSCSRRKALGRPALSRTLVGIWFCNFGAVLFFIAAGSVIRKLSWLYLIASALLLGAGLALAIVSTRQDHAERKRLIVGLLVPLLSLLIFAVLVLP